MKYTVREVHVFKCPCSLQLQEAGPSNVAPATRKISRMGGKLLKNASRDLFRFVRLPLALGTLICSDGASGYIVKLILVLGLLPVASMMLCDPLCTSPTFTRHCTMLHALAEFGRMKMKRRFGNFQ